MATDAAIDGEVFTFVERLGTLAGEREVVAALERMLAMFRISYFMFLHKWPVPGEFEKLVFCRRLPERWYDIYLREGYGDIDPAFAPRRRSDRPFLWPAAPTGETAPPRTAAFVRRAAEFGLMQGLVVPIPRDGRRPGVVWLGGPNGKFAIRTIAALRVVALYAFERLLQFRAPARRGKPPITRREREALTLAAEGKNAREIGKVLGINKRTVEEHLGAAKRKLGAVNRTQAVVIALREGDIDICP